MADHGSHTDGRARPWTLVTDRASVANMTSTRKAT